MRILGISAYYHDAAAALLDGGRIVAAAQEERFSRKKHDAGVPAQAARFCLAQAGLSMADVDEVVFYEQPLRKFERILVTHLREFPRSLPQFPRALSTWLGSRLWTSGDLCAQLGARPEQLRFGQHHLSHAASAFFSSPFDDAAVITVDGVGEWATTGIYHGRSDARGSRLDCLGELHFPHSIGLLYSAITAYLGFEVNEGECQTMALAAWGRPHFRDAFAQLAQLDSDGALTLDTRYFSYQRHPTRSFTSALEALLGPARAPDQPFDPSRPEAQRFADIAATLQELTERYLLLLAREAKRRTGARAVCLAGGVALNCVANRALQDRGPFEQVFVQPAAGDAGGALGAAQWAAHVIHGEPRGPALEHAFLGAAYDDASVERFLADCGAAAQRFADDATLAAAVAERLTRGEVGGWFRGRFEWGPRALGARSIVADPRTAAMRDRVNAKIKFREGFRPFAPAVLRDEAARWFELPAGDRLSPFMCTVAPATLAGRRALAGVLHADGSARLQCVDDGPLAPLLHAMRDRTGIGCVLNTSMNLKGEPPVASPAEAYGVLLRSELDFLVLEHSLVERAALAGRGTAPVLKEKAA